MVLDENIKKRKPICVHCGSKKIVEIVNQRLTDARVQTYRCRVCSNNFMVLKNLKREVINSATTIDNLLNPKEIKETQNYSQDWSAYNQAQTKEKEMFIEILSELNSLLEVEYRKRKGRPNNQLQDMIFACAIKVYSGLSSRRVVSELSLLEKSNFISRVPHFNSITNYFNDKSITPILKKLIELSSLPLKSVEEDFAVDSSGFSTSIFSRWFDHKWGKKKGQRTWRKAHLLSGVKTNIVCSAEITDGFRADCTQLPYLLEQTAKNFQIRELSADKAYSSKKILTLVSDNGGIPYIPFKKHATKRRPKHKIWKTMYEYFLLKRNEFMEHYHKRSNAESVFHMIKTKFGNSLKSKTDVGQTNEILTKILCHNLCCLIQEIHELGIEVNYCAEKYPAQKIII